MPTQPPISGELWDRLRRLDPYCSINMHRGEPHGRRWSGLRRTWHVRIHAHRSKIWDAVATEAGTLGEALLKAVELSERQGWHLPERKAG